MFTYSVRTMIGAVVVLICLPVHAQDLPSLTAKPPVDEGIINAKPSENLGHLSDVPKLIRDIACGHDSAKRLSQSKSE